MSNDKLLDTLQHMSESRLTQHILAPLLRELHPASVVEETHGPLEAGRDLLCFTTHAVLNRQFVLCVQAKNHQLSYGTSGPYSISTIKNQVEMARKTGVTTQAGNIVLPDEIWVINTYSFADGARRQCQAILREITLLNGKIIDGSELSVLLHRYLPSIVEELLGWKEAGLSNIISGLSVHQESRAFGLRFDRRIDDFHVTANVSPTAGLATLLLDSSLTANLYSVTVTEPIPRLSKSPDNPREISETDDEYSDRCSTLFIRQGSTGCEVRESDRTALGLAAQVDHEFGVPVVWQGRLDRAQAELIEIKGVLRKAKKGYRFEREYQFDFPSACTQVRTELEFSLKRLPRDVEDDPGAVADILAKRLRTENLMNTCKDLNILAIGAERATPVHRLISVRNEQAVLGLGQRLLIEGPAGSGKTTFLRRLAISLLSRGERVFFVNGALLEPLRGRTDDVAILRAGAPKDTPLDWGFSDSVVLIDGLDECSLDLTSVVELLQDARNVVASVRPAYPTPLRKVFHSIELVPFSRHDRDLFFSRWFSDRSDWQARVQELIQLHTDIDHHTRNPLLATLVAALIENGYSPTTRTDIYEHRLRLLLGDWDKFRGVKRASIHPMLKLRYLRHLAFEAHWERKRLVSLDIMHQVFAEALGVRGRSVAFDQLVRELVVAAGVLIEDRAGHFTFGHLSFQEHLAGWHLAELNNENLVVEVLDRDWWTEPLRFYAGIKGDITDLIDICEQHGTSMNQSKRLLDMAGYAPFTSDVAVDILREWKSK